MGVGFVGLVRILVGANRVGFVVAQPTILRICVTLGEFDTEGIMDNP